MSDRILRLQHVQIRVPDLELCTAYYTELVGLIETSHEDGRVFLKCWDEHQHHSVVLTFAPTHGLAHFGFKVTDHADLDHYTARLEAAGVVVKRLAPGEWAPGHGESIRFDLPLEQSVTLRVAQSSARAVRRVSQARSPVLEERKSS